MEFNRLKDENLLEKYEPSWKGEVDLSLGDADGLFYPLVVQPLLLIGNESSTMPKDWTDLAKPEYKGKYNIFKTYTISISIMVKNILSSLFNTAYNIFTIYNLTMIISLST